MRRPRLDQSLPVLAKGYAWLPDRRRAAGRDTVQTRLMGVRRTLGVAGPAGARFLYDEDHVRRSGALPEPVVSTLFGHGAVHTLDGEPHRVRKAMFVQLLMDRGTADLVDRVGAAWDAAVPRWAAQPQVVLMDEAARVLTRGVCDWAGVPVSDEELPALAGDLTTLVDGFATGAPRHWRARRVRQRREAWLAGVVDAVRAGERSSPAGSVLDVVATHRDSEGELLEPRVAAVEVLNVIRPTVAVSWFVGFAAHALHRWPASRDRLRAGGAYAFRPERFLTGDGDRVRDIGPWELVPQGAGDPRTGHRCPGEDVTVALLASLAVRLARLGYRLPDQDLTISLRRIPARPASGVVLSDVRPG
jgi:fatty-acid peroxygenase